MAYVIHLSSRLSHEKKLTTCVSGESKISNHPQLSNLMSLSWIYQLKPSDNMGWNPTLTTQLGPWPAWVCNSNFNIFTTTGQIHSDKYIITFRSLRGIEWSIVSSSVCKITVLSEINTSSIFYIFSEHNAVNNEHAADAYKPLLHTKLECSDRTQMWGGTRPGGWPEKTFAI